MVSKPSKTSTVQFIEISAAQDGQRIDNFLLSLEKGVPKSRIYKAIRKGEVRINKGRIKQTYKLQAGDLVRVPPLRIAEKSTINTVSDYVRQQLDANILLEDNDLLILNKPSGMAVHAGSNIEQGIIEAMRIIRPELAYLELVHRLDRETSGCLLFAKNRHALLNLQTQLISHDIDKRYLTLLKGNWSNGERRVQQPLRKNSISSGERMVVIAEDGKDADSLFIPTKHYADAQLTEVVIFTGRTHQIRVHANYLGHPLAGDDKYGDRKFNKFMKQKGLKRLFLHAWKLTITHPTTGETLPIEAALPNDLTSMLKQLDHAQ